jgi:hypothetical protein
VRSHTQTWSPTAARIARRVSCWRARARSCSLVRISMQPLLEVAREPKEAGERLSPRGQRKAMWESRSQATATRRIQFLSARFEFENDTPFASRHSRSARDVHDAPRRAGQWEALAMRPLRGACDARKRQRELVVRCARIAVPIGALVKTISRAFSRESIRYATLALAKCFSVPLRCLAEVAFRKLQ